jgi:hypothetical protein
MVEKEERPPDVLEVSIVSVDLSVLDFAGAEVWLLPFARNGVPPSPGEPPILVRRLRVAEVPGSEASS